MKAKKILFYILAGILGGCVPVMSLHPLYTQKDITFKKELLGTWVGDDNETWQFTADDEPNKPEKTYHLIFTDKEGKKGSFTATLVKLEDKIFLDVCPEQYPCTTTEEANQIGWLYNQFFFIRVHTFIRVESTAPKLKLKLTNDENMKELLEQDPNAIAHESIDDESFVLTAPTEELQAFVLKYADDERVFSDETTLVKETAQEPNTPQAGKEADKREQ